MIVDSCTTIHYLHRSRSPHVDLHGRAGLNQALGKGCQIGKFEADDLQHIDTNNYSMCGPKKKTRITSELQHSSVMAQQTHKSSAYKKKRIERVGLMLLIQLCTEINYTVK